MTLRRFLIGSIVLLLAAMPPAAAQSKKQLEKDKAKVEQELKKLASDYANVKKNSKAVQRQLQQLEGVIVKRTDLINNLNGQLNLLTISIAETEDSIRMMHTQIDSLRREYSRAVRVLYRQRGNLDRMTLVLDTKAYNKAYLRTKFFREYSRYRLDLVKAIRDKKLELSNKGVALHRQQHEQTTLMEEHRQQRDSLAREQREQQKQLDSSKQKEKKLQQQIAQKEKQKRQLQQQIQRIIDEEVEKARKAAAAKNSGGGKSKANDADVVLSKNFADNKGKLPWPVKYNKVEREFGRYTHSSGGQNMNNGIDLLCASGTAVKCVFDGVVSKMFIGPDGTKGLIVRHGTYMTVYLHLGTVTVNEGAKVKTGQNLGTVYTDPAGNTEFSFQVWKEKTVQDPRQWLR